MTDKRPLILGVTHRSPYSSNTYSGVPLSLFKEFEKKGCLVGVADAYLRKPIDIFRGFLDVKRSLSTCSLKPNKLWRFSEQGMTTLSKRFQDLERQQPEHNVVFRFEVGGLPIDSVKLVAHVEISIETAVNTEMYAKSFNLDGFSKKKISEAIKIEKYFLDRCDIIWTNSEWCKRGLQQHGIQDDKFFVAPPPPTINDPGEIHRDWDVCRILFAGRQWERKGGDILIRAFQQVRKRLPSAQLYIIGCSPCINEKGVTVEGFLDKDNSNDLKRIQQLYRDASLFCLPSLWDSTGIVYMEAALYGLPLVMLKGQGREKIFPKEMAIQLEKPDPGILAEILIECAKSPEKMNQMGKIGREIVLEKYTSEKLAQSLYSKIEAI